MITPSYSATATERVLPRMALDFTTGVLDSRVTVTRALNTATRVNSSGLVEIVSANLPRFDYNPATLAPKGLLIEEARTNIAPFSDQFDNAAWVKTRCSITANATASPDGTTNADKLVEDTTASSSHLVQSATLTVAALSTVTVSIFMKAAERTWGRIGDGGGSGIFAFVNLSTGQFGTIGGGVTNSRIESFNNGWYRVSITGVMTGVLSQMLIYAATADNTSTYTGNGTSGIFIYGAQIEVGAFATSYIPTTTLAVLRNADDVTMSGTNFTSWYNASEGSLSLKYLKSTTQVSGRYVARFFSPTVGAGVSYWINSNGIDTRYWIGATNAAIGNGSLVNVNTGAFSYKTATSTGALNGAANVANAGTVPLDVTEFRIGDAGGINAHIQRILYWPFALTAAEIRANSKG